MCFQQENNLIILPDSFQYLMISVWKCCILTFAQKLKQTQKKQGERQGVLRVNAKVLWGLLEKNAKQWNIYFAMLL